MIVKFFAGDVGLAFTFDALNFIFCFSLPKLFQRIFQLSPTQIKHLLKTNPKRIRQKPPSELKLLVTSMMETKCDDGNFQTLVTVLAIFVTKILYILTLA